MKRIVIAVKHGGSLVGAKDQQIPLQKGRNEVEQEDLDAAMARKGIARLFGKILHLEDVPAEVQPPVASIAGPKAKSHAHDPVKHEAKK